MKVNKGASKREHDKRERYEHSQAMKEPYYRQLHRTMTSCDTAAKALTKRERTELATACESLAEVLWNHLSALRQEHNQTKAMF